ncbi:MAG: YtxH domain-containing protein [Candidatus Limnocylindria bacterium]
MPVAPVKTAEEIASGLSSIVDRLRDADLPSTAAESGKQIADALAEVTAQLAERAGDTARDIGDEARKTWRRGIGRSLRDAWKRRNLALGAAGAAVPVSKQLVDSAAVRLGLKRREERHWGSFFIGLLLGAAAGVIIAILTAPKPGREIRDDLAARAREAGDWVPVFQRSSDVGDAETNGDAIDASLSSETGGMSTAGSSVPPILADDGGTGRPE